MCVWRRRKRRRRKRRRRREKAILALPVQSVQMLITVMEDRLAAVSSTTRIQAAVGLALVANLTSPSSSFWI